MLNPFEGQLQMFLSVPCYVYILKSSFDGSGLAWKVGSVLYLSWSFQGYLIPMGFWLEKNNNQDTRVLCNDFPW